MSAIFIHIILTKMVIGATTPQVDVWISTTIMDLASQQLMQKCYCTQLVGLSAVILKKALMAARRHRMNAETIQHHGSSLTSGRSLMLVRKGHLMTNPASCLQMAVPEG